MEFNGSHTDKDIAEWVDPLTEDERKLNEEQMEFDFESAYTEMYKQIKKGNSTQADSIASFVKPTIKVGE